ncbi:hypothetical protein Tco_1013625, partial [Tanacetum coccineum]
EVILRKHEGDDQEVKNLHLIYEVNEFNSTYFEAKSLHDSYISKILYLSEGDDAILIEGQKLPLAELATLWHAFDMEEGDRIVHVIDVGR